MLIALIAAVLWWKNKKNKRRHREQAMQMQIHYGGGPGGDPARDTAPAQRARRPSSLALPGHVSGYTAPVPAGYNHQQPTGTTVATTTPWTMEEGLRNLKAAVWVTLPGDAKITPPMRTTCEKGIFQLTKEDLRVFPLGLPFHAAILILDVLGTVCTIRHHAHPEEGPAWKIPQLTDVLNFLPPAAFEAVVHPDPRPRQERTTSLAISRDGTTHWRPTRAQIVESSHPVLQMIHATNLAVNQTTTDLIGTMPRLKTFRNRTRTRPEVRSWRNNNKDFLPRGEIENMTRSLKNTLAGMTAVDFEQSLKTRTELGGRNMSVNKHIMLMERHETTTHEGMKGLKLQGSEFRFFQPAPAQLTIARWENGQKEEEEKEEKETGQNEGTAEASKGQDKTNAGCRSKSAEHSQRRDSSPDADSTGKTSRQPNSTPGSSRGAHGAEPGRLTHLRSSGQHSDDNDHDMENVNHADHPDPCDGAQSSERPRGTDGDGANGNPVKKHGSDSAEQDLESGTGRREGSRSYSPRGQSSPGGGVKSEDEIPESYAGRGRDSATDPQEGVQDTRGRGWDTDSEEEASTGEVRGDTGGTDHRMLSSNGGGDMQGSGPPPPDEEEQGGGDSRTGRRGAPGTRVSHPSAYHRWASGQASTIWARRIN